MSMMGRFVQVSPDKLNQLIDDPSDVEELFASPQAAGAMSKLLTPAMQERMRALSPEMVDKAMQAMPPAMRDRLNQSLKQLGVDPNALARGEQGEALAKLIAQRMQAAGVRAPGQPGQPTAAQPSAPQLADITLDKAWHGVHYLLCGRAVPDSTPASQAVMGGTDIGDDLGYGPARYFEPAQVADIARDLSDPNLEATMTARFDPAQMTTLGIYPGVWNADDRQWLLDAFRKLRQFYVDASAAKLAVVACIE